MRNVVSLFLLGLLMCLSSLTTGCATIFHGSSQTISLSTDPPDALVRAGGNTYKSPAQAILRRDADYIITAEKDGFETSQGTITHSVHWPTFLGNIIFGGLIGWAIDFSSGAAYKLEPENLIIPLKQKVAKSGRESGALPSAPPESKPAKPTSP